MAGQKVRFTPNRVIDSNGIADGATVAFYQSGTTTLQTVYADAALTVPLANPYTINAGAAFPTVYVDAKLSYRMILRDIAGNVIEDADPYKGVTASDIVIDSGGTVQDIADAIGLTPEMFGAVGDGGISGSAATGTDDTAAMTAFFAAAKASPSYISFTRGKKYRITSPVCWFGTAAGGAIGIRGFDGNDAEIICDYDGGCALDMTGVPNGALFGQGDLIIRVPTGRTLDHGVVYARPKQVTGIRSSGNGIVERIQVYGRFNGAAIYNVASESNFYGKAFPNNDLGWATVCTKTDIFRDCFRLPMDALTRLFRPGATVTGATSGATGRIFRSGHLLYTFGSVSSSPAVVDGDWCTGGTSGATGKIGYHKDDASGGTGFVYIGRCSKPFTNGEVVTTSRGATFTLTSTPSSTLFVKKLSGTFADNEALTDNGCNLTLAATGSWAPNDTITGGTSGAVGKVYRIDGATLNILVTSGTFQVGEAITSGAKSGTINAVALGGSATSNIPSGYAIIGKASPNVDVEEATTASFQVFSDTFYASNLSYDGLSSAIMVNNFNDVSVETVNLGTPNDAASLLVEVIADFIIRPPASGAASNGFKMKSAYAHAAHWGSLGLGCACTMAASPGTTQTFSDTDYQSPLFAGSEDWRVVNMAGPKLLLIGAEMRVNGSIDLDYGIANGTNTFIISGRGGAQFRALNTVEGRLYCDSTDTVTLPSGVIQDKLTIEYADLNLVHNQAQKAVTLASDAAAVTAPLIVVSAETGTSDTLSTLSLPSGVKANAQRVGVLCQNTHTITIDTAAGNIKGPSGQTLSSTEITFFVRNENAGTWTLDKQAGGGGGGSSALAYARVTGAGTISDGVNCNNGAVGVGSATKVGTGHITIALNTAVPSNAKVTCAIDSDIGRMVAAYLSSATEITVKTRSAVSTLNDAGFWVQVDAV